MKLFYYYERFVTSFTKKLYFVLSYKFYCFMIILASILVIVDYFAN